MRKWPSPVTRPDGAFLKSSSSSLIFIWFLFPWVAEKQAHQRLLFCLRFCILEKETSRSQEPCFANLRRQQIICEANNLMEVSIMLSFYKVIERAYVFIANRDSIAYLYGGDGRICTEEYFYQWLLKYPNRIKPEDVDRIRDFTVGKRIYDCSQLVVECFQCPDMTSAGLIKRCNPVTTDLSLGPEASVLYKKGHVGLDLGCGYALDIPTEGQTVRVRRISDGGWTQSGQLTIYCNYNGARVMDPNREVKRYGV